MRPSEKRQIREAQALQRIKAPVVFHQKLLQEYINTLRKLTEFTNDNVTDDLVCTIQLIEKFQWLPKGEYTIKIIIE